MSQTTLDPRAIDVDHRNLDDIVAYQEARIEALSRALRDSERERAELKAKAEERKAYIERLLEEQNERRNA